jgi:hypothetical protein
MNYVEEYARRWTKSEGKELETFFEWIKSIRKLLKIRIYHLSYKILFTLLSLKIKKRGKRIA